MAYHLALGDDDHGTFFLQALREAVATAKQA